MAHFAPDKLHRIASGAVHVLDFSALRIVFTLAGLCAGLYGAAVGFVLGFLADIARLEERERRRLKRFLEKPEPGSTIDLARELTAASAIALSDVWPGISDRRTRILLFERFAAEILRADAHATRDVERAIDVASRCGSCDIAALARRLAALDGGPGQTILARWAYALAALGGSPLRAADEMQIRAALADCGIGGDAQAAARAAAFPRSKDPWTVLGLSPGASNAEVKRAYRRLSRLFHPDMAAGAEDGGERFREVGEAYAALSGKTREVSTIEGDPRF